MFSQSQQYVTSLNRTTQLKVIVESTVIDKVTRLKSKPILHDYYT